MKSKCVLVGVTLLQLISVSPAPAAPREIEYYCYEQALRATLPLRRGAGEAFMANCIADLTPPRPRSGKRRTGR